MAAFGWAVSVLITKMKALILLLFSSCLCNSALADSLDIIKPHDRLNDEGIQRIFHRHRRDVPDYEFVTIKSDVHEHRSKRELRPVELETDGKNVQLHLHPAEHTVMTDYIPAWTAHSSLNVDSIYRPIDEEEKKLDGIVYEDRENMATLMAYYKNRYIYYDGVFGESDEMKVIRSALEKWWKRPTSEENKKNHFIYKVHDSGKTVALQSNTSEEYEKLDKPIKIFYPKLLVIVDYPLFELLGKNIKETMKYVATFWSAVNLKYSKIESPQIKIIITGLIIAQDPLALKYCSQARNQSNLDSLNPHKLLNLGREYFRTKFFEVTDFDNYDTTITMSSLDSGSVAGVAYVGSICTKDYNIGYVRDDGNFGGILTATHELGHLLNLPHDDANGCDGYVDDYKATVMAPFLTYVKEYIWSECSKNTLREFAWYKKASCLDSYYRQRSREN